MNITAEQANGIVRCECGSKYWGNKKVLFSKTGEWRYKASAKTTCVDCGNDVRRYANQLLTVEQRLTKDVVEEMMGADSCLEMALKGLEFLVENNKQKYAHHYQLVSNLQATIDETCERLKTKAKLTDEMMDY